MLGKIELSLTEYRLISNKKKWHIMYVIYQWAQSFASLAHTWEHIWVLRPRPCTESTLEGIELTPKSSEEVRQRPPCHFPGEHRKPLTSHWGCLSDGWMCPCDQLCKWDTQQHAVFSLTLLVQALTAGMSLDFNQMGILNQDVPFQYVVKLITQPEVKAHEDTWPGDCTDVAGKWPCTENRTFNLIQLVCVGLKSQHRQKCQLFKENREKWQIMRNHKHA